MKIWKSFVAFLVVLAALLFVYVAAAQTKIDLQVGVPYPPPIEPTAMPSPESWAVRSLHIWLIADSDDRLAEAWPSLARPDQQVEIIIQAEDGTIRLHGHTDFYTGDDDGKRYHGILVVGGE